MRKVIGMAAALLAAPLLVNSAPASADQGPARWENDTVCVEDHVGPHWGSVLDNAAQQYNSHADLKVAYMFNGTGCRGWDQVIKVHWYSDADDNRVGYTQMVWSGDYFVSPTEVYLNSHYVGGMTWKERLHVVNHELGHAFGMGHNDRTDSVMGGPEQNWLSRYDRDELHRIYPW